MTLTGEEMGHCPLFNFLMLGIILNAFFFSGEIATESSCGLLEDGLSVNVDVLRAPGRVEL